MEQIKDIDSLAGKTIKVAVDDGGAEENLVLTFDDGTYFHVNISYDGDRYGLNYFDGVEDRLKVEAGIISEEEYDKKIKQQQERANKLYQEREYQEYLRLKEKFA